MPRSINQSTRALISEAESEFDAPFWDIVRGFAADGYARGTTAKILGFSGPDVFRRLQQREGVSIDWPAHGQCNAMKEPRGEYTGERTAKRLASMGFVRSVAPEAKKPRAPSIPPKGKGWQAEGFAFY